MLLDTINWKLLDFHIYTYCIVSLLVISFICPTCKILNDLYATTPVVLMGNNVTHQFQQFFTLKLSSSHDTWIGSDAVRTHIPIEQTLIVVLKILEQVQLHVQSFF